MGQSGTKSEGWVKSGPLAPHIELWWSKLLPPQRKEVLEEFDGHLADWMAQGLLRAGVPLSIDPGLAPGSTAGSFLVPRELIDFVDAKRRQPERKKRFWSRRDKS